MFDAFKKKIFATKIHSGSIPVDTVLDFNERIIGFRSTATNFLGGTW